MSTTSTMNQYYNSYDSSKKYTELLFRPGKVLQVGETNEMQSMLKNQIKNIGDTVLTNGDIIEGCQLIIDATNVTITKGKIYLQGDVRDVESTELQISGSGTETIGVILKQEVITADDDNSLLDQASGYDNYNQDGAYRLKESVEVVLNNSNAAILYSLVDGQQLTINTAEDLTQLEKVNNTLARRTFDESGNYKVTGLQLTDKNYSDANKIYVSLEVGKAYVKGYEVSKTNASSVGLEKATTIRSVESEPKIYRADTTRYSLNNNYVDDITKVVSIVSETANITRGSISGGIDYLPLTPVVEVASVRQGAKTFVKGVDYQLINDGIDWSIGSDAPDTGSTYEVIWSYNKIMRKNSDFELYYDEDTAIGYIDFIEDGDKPVEGTTFLIDYNFMLCRRDVISLDKDGNVVISKGQPDVLRLVESPNVSSDEVLILGTVLLKPKTTTPIIFNSNIQAVTVADLYNLIDRINALEYNQSVTDLDTEAAAGEDATELVGIFTDGFIGLTKSDVYHSEWTASIDLDNQTCTLPYETSVSTLIPNEEESYNVGVFNRMMTTPYTEITVISQTSATEALRINSYSAFPKRPSVSINPQVDNWIEENKVVIQGQTTQSVALTRWWYHKGEAWAEQEKNLWASYGITVGDDVQSSQNTVTGGSSTSVSTSGWWRTTTTTTTHITTTILNEAIMYMRQRDIDVTIENMAPNADNIKGLFDGKEISFTPLNAYYNGSTEGTLKADSKGTAKGKFTIPTNTLCGTRELRVWAENTPSYVGSANYTASGRKISEVKRVWTSTTVSRYNTDPLAQSFQFAIDQYLTGVGIYFLDKDSVEPITVQIRDMVNGYPGTTVYAVSTSAAVETKVTFDDPVYCEAGTQYCFTVLTNSDIDSLWVAEMNKLDITTNTSVAKNPYLDGTLFSSSNALTWTAHQNTDLKFNLYGAKFNSQGSVEFQEIEDVNFDRIMVMSEESIPTGCSISWQYKVNEDKEWSPIEVYSDRLLTRAAEKVKLRATLKSNGQVSPVIALDSLSFIGFKNNLSSTYISRNVSVPDGFNTAKVIVDLYLPAGTNVNVFCATDQSGTVWEALESTGSEIKNQQYKTYTFEKALSETKTNYRVKVVLTTTDSINIPNMKNLRSIMKEV